MPRKKLQNDPDFLPREYESEIPTKLGKQKGDNKIFNSPFKDQAWDWLKSGQSPEQVRRALAVTGLHVSLPVVYAFRTKMEEEMRDDDTGKIVPLDNNNSLYTTAINLHEQEQVKNDGVFLDMVIQRSMAFLMRDDSIVSIPLALRAIELKKSMLGASYKGQTIWALMDIQDQFDAVVDIINKYVDTHTFELIIQELERRGYASVGEPQPVKKMSLEATREIMDAVSADDEPDDIDYENE